MIITWIVVAFLSMQVQTDDASLFQNYYGKGLFSSIHHYVEKEWHLRLDDDRSFEYKIQSHNNKFDEHDEILILIGTWEVVNDTLELSIAGPLKKPWCENMNFIVESDRLVVLELCGHYLPEVSKKLRYLSRFNPVQSQFDNVE